jgi:hypothetical protein
MDDVVKKNYAEALSDAKQIVEEKKLISDGSLSLAIVLLAVTMYNSRYGEV